MAEGYPSEGGRRPAPPASGAKNDRGLGVAALAFAILLSAAALYLAGPPGAVPADAAADAFSSERALKKLEVIARSPRPLGSAEHGRARDFILSELRAAGLEPEVQAAVGLRARGGRSVVAGSVQNIVARLRGSGGSGGGAVLLACHYDTVPNSPGAGDDGSAVATLLETLRALKAGPQPKNDLIFLFTDGEEAGLLGARAFAEEHSLARDVRAVLNFDARGSKGPVIMFETSGQSGWLVEELAASAPHPRATSLASAIYRLLPNDTDLTVFKEAGMPGLNFAFIDGSMRYHTRADSIANVDERSLQHQGSYALALARRLGEQSLDGRGGAEPIYFDLPGLGLVRYSAALVLPLAALAAVLLLAVAALGVRRGRLTAGAVVRGVAAFVLTAVLSAGLAWLLWWAISSVQRWAGRGLQDDFYQGKLYLAGLSVLCVAAGLAAYQWFGRRASLEALALGAQVCCLVLLAASCLLLPGGSYLLEWPLVFGCLGLAYALLTGREGGGGVVRFLVLALCAVPGVLLLVPTVYSLFVAVGLNMVWAVAALAGVAAGLLIPHMGLAAGGLGGLRVAAGAALAGVALLLLAALAFDFDERHPRSNNVFYVLNADTGQAIWAGTERAPDEWTAQFFGPGTERGPAADYLPQYGGSFLKHAAPAVERRPAEVRLLEDGAGAGGVRTLRLNIQPSQPGARVWASIEPKAEVLSAIVNGKRAGPREAGAGGPAAAGAWTLQYWAAPAGGIELTLEVRAAGPLNMVVVEQTEGLPQVPGLSVRPRPGHLMPSSFLASDATLVKKSYTF